MKNKVLLVADMEGCSGIYDLSNSISCREKMILEVDYIISILKKYGYQNISILDCHNDGLSLKDYCKEKDIDFICHVWSLDSFDQYSFAMLIGFHGKAGSGGYFSHTVRPDILNILSADTSVGEVFLMCNFLSYYKIPVLYISGDKTIENELNDYKGVFLATKQIGEKTKQLTENKYVIECAVYAALNKITECVYYDAPIEVQLIGTNYSKFIPQEIFVVKYNSVFFKDTVDFFYNLKRLCLFLNIAEEYHNMRMKVLASKIKNQKRDILVKDHRASYLLNSLNWRQFSDEDFYYLTNYINEKEIW